ncbi:MAG: PTS IIA-like nitrogen regulatory protein PtsN [Xanthomonadales bacterium]|nr:PTS IIA-like nitrogen regulatory protein PtsN [Xanthomonadales bacterium]NIN59052.1 PTS IIA-like nitrogen regulatory protein PtsN [Xanthomonadales bacterium]NIN74356.1 PTS IIA-like nitrogen regulatory protein PtsN [Xanthomonadales bacterium]NIO13941.1 PTS IIA-like nitrogen regulatory protein PtsN [Xanthomonadales bacterium]NIP11445.1 PTS IIA-like nitrogen regulatory protein PtsN [Xanthomonadales bacterium]
MLVSDLLSTERVLPNVRVSSKKRLLELISKALVQHDRSLDHREVFESLCARERLGSTGLGNGIAIPHGRVQGSEAVQAVFVRLVKPLPFDAADSKPVDLLFALAVPENCTADHLKLLSQIAEKFSDAALLEKLRTAEDAAELVHLLSEAHH